MPISSARRRPLGTSASACGPRAPTSSAGSDWHFSMSSRRMRPDHRKRFASGAACVANAEVRAHRCLRCSGGGGCDGGDGGDVGGGGGEGVVVGREEAEQDELTKLPM